MHHKHGIQLNAGFNAAFNYNQCLSIFIQQSLGIRRKSFNQPQAYSKRVRDAAFFLIIMLVTFAATLLKPQKYVSSRTIQKCVEHVSTST